MANSASDGQPRKRRRSVRRTSIEEGISESQLHRAIRRRELPAYRIGLRTVLLNTEDVDRWLEAHRFQPPKSVAKRVTETVAKEALA